MKVQEGRNTAYKQLTITDVRDEAPGVKTFVFEDAHSVAHKAGQFLTFVFDNIQGEERRSYSLSSSPVLNEPLSITVKRVENGKYSRPLIDHARPGDKLIVTGDAAGQFTLPENLASYRQLFFFAAGVGITPIFSIIKTLLYEHSHIEVILVYSNQSTADTVFYTALLALHEAFKDRFRLEFLFSTNPDLSRARLSKWLLPQLLKVYHNADKQQQLFYTCGPFAYMRMVTISLEEAGYTPQQIRKENFDNSRPVLTKEPPDKSPHQVTIVRPDTSFHFLSQYPQTILQAARQNGLVLPYSCETGRCGSCLAYCTKGAVWMSYNEVLTDKDIAEGKVLTCVGYPINGDLTLEL